MLASCTFVACFDRKTGIKFYLTLAASVTLLFIIGGNNRNRHWAFDIALYAGYYGIKLSPNIGFVLVYQVAAHKLVYTDLLLCVRSVILR